MSLGGLISNFVWYIGFTTLTVGLRRLASFLHIYTLHSSTVQRYLTDDDKAFALVTGASDGLGKELVKDLYERGVRSFMEPNHCRASDRLMRFNTVRRLISHFIV